MSGVSVRRATLADADAIAALHVTCWHDTYGQMLPADMVAAHTIETRSRMWRGIFASAQGSGSPAVLIAEKDGLPIGFGSCGVQRDRTLAEAGFTGEFSAIYLRQEHQAQGVGRAILGTMSAMLFAQGHRGACLWVLRENMPARNFYDRLGGIPVGEKIDRRPHGVLVEAAYGWRDLATLASARLAISG